MDFLSLEQRTRSRADRSLRLIASIDAATWFFRSRAGERTCRSLIRAGSESLGTARRLAIWLTVALWYLAMGDCSAQTTQTGSSSRFHREQAVKLIPYAQLNEETRKKITEVVDSASLYRRLPVNTILAEPDYFRFLVRYPEVVVNIWQLMGVTQMTTQRTGPFTIDTDDGAGTVSTLDLVFGNENLHIFFGTGTYEGPVLKRKLHGRCVLILRTEYRKDRAGQDLVVNQMDIFLKLDNVGANLVAKTIQPIVGPTADQNFSDSLKFVQRLNETTVENGPGVQHMAGRLNIDEPTRQKFIEAAGAVFEKASQQRASASSNPVRVPSLAGNALSGVDPGQRPKSAVGHATMIDTIGYSYQAEPTTQSPTRLYGNLGFEPVIPAFRMSPGFAAPSYSTDSYSTDSKSR